jgi:hypothetical protein
LSTREKHDIVLSDDIPTTSSDMIPVARRDLEIELMQLINRVHKLRKLLGLPPLMTGKERRRRQLLEP